MASSRTPFLFISLLLLLLISFFQFSSTQPMCHEFERLALIQFKNSFLIEENASGDPLAYPKVNLWKNQGINCCSWEGVTCSQHTSRVIGLDLGSSRLFGSINSSSSLFRLGHLQYLNLAYNNFNYSEIPPAFGNLTRLTYLNLSRSLFSGQVPFEISKLSKLAKLDLSKNFDDPDQDQGLLELKPHDFQSLIQNLSRLEDLRLSLVTINSSIPHALANMSSLTILGLRECGLFGELPNAIFQLPKLETLSVRHNFGLTGNLPEFHCNNPLKDVDVSSTNLFGEIPKYMGFISSLEYFKAINCNVSGFLPSSPSNLTYFRLRVLHLSYNHITGPFPSWITNLTQLEVLSLWENMIQGTLPSSISKLENLEDFNIVDNNLRGTVEMGTFLGLKHLTYLSLSGNSFSVLTKSTSTNNTRPKLFLLDLASCNLPDFPAFLHNQDQLQFLDLANNKIHGHIPKWLLEMSPNMEILDLSRNLLTSFEELNHTIPSSLLILNVGFNSLEGSLPIPPHSIVEYIATGNQFSGEIPLEFCNTTSLNWLDLSGNKLSGIIPQCLGNNTNSLSNLNLGQNNLQGKVPRSLANCKSLEYLDLGNNQIRDVFPSWLGLLPHLKIIFLRFNRFRGAIDGSKSNSLFPLLRIIDLSQNEFSGPLPLQHFKRWNAMANFDEKNATYLSKNQEATSVGEYAVVNEKPYSMTITNKGKRMDYEEVLDIFTAIDLSCNKFTGRIPKGVGSLRGLELLNISNNLLTGSIPPELGSLSKLEAVDLSHNKLSGRIPTELTQLTFLEVFNVANNLLTGPIPRGLQFDTFENNSFEGNPGLCGMPLSKKCESSPPPPPSSSEENGHTSLLYEISWKAVLIGLGCGFIGGSVLGINVFKRKKEWFMATFRIRQGRRSA